MYGAPSILSFKKIRISIDVWTPGMWLAFISFQDIHFVQDYHVRERNDDLQTLIMFDKIINIC